MTVSVPWVRKMQENDHFVRVRGMIAGDIVPHSFGVIITDKDYLLSYGCTAASHESSLTESKSLKNRGLTCVFALNFNKINCKYSSDMSVRIYIISF